MTQVTFAQRGGRPVAIKKVDAHRGERHAAAILRAYDGRGVVRVYAEEPGAMVLERLVPGTPLAQLTLAGRDDKATDVLADVMARMRSAAVLSDVPHALDWGAAFAAYEASGDRQIAHPLVAAAHQVYVERCETQTAVQLLHGDLHHHNVLFDRERGWLAIDPKGVTGELAFETGAALRNPIERPDLFAARPIIERRARHFADALALDESRVLRWAFAQAVLCTIWEVEDGAAVTPDHPWIVLAETIRELIDERTSR